MTYGDEITPTCNHSNDFSFLDAFIHRLDGTGENPWMKSFERFLFTFLQIYALIHIYIYLID